MKISREIKTGIVAVLIIFLFIWGYSYMKDISFGDKNRMFYAEYENVQGLVKTSPVMINGLKVGRVSDITFHPNKSGVLVVHMEMLNDFDFPRNSVAQIFSPDFISGKSLRIQIPDIALETAKSGDTLAGLLEEGIMGMINEQIGPLQKKVESFIVNTDTVMGNINALLNPKNQENFSKSMENLNLTLQKFKKISYKADKIIDENNGKIDSLFVNANSSMNSFAMITDSLQKADLAATVIKLQSTLDSFNIVLDSIQNGKGTLGKLINDEGVYTNLEGATRELEELLREMKEHPKRFVHFSMFGKKETSYQPEVQNQE